MPLDARCFLISLSVPYQLKPLVECPMRGRCTLASRRRMKNKNKPTGKLEKVVHWYKKWRKQISRRTNDAAPGNKESSDESLIEDSTSCLSGLAVGSAL